jgi:cytochrome b
MSESRIVWDWPLRLVHWGLVLAVLGAYGTAELGWLSMDWHFRFGYLALGLVVFRVLWGFLGTRHARFASFLSRPSQLWAYLRAGFGGARVWVGHSPLGGWASVVLLLAVLIQAGSGLFNGDDIEWFGPWFDVVGAQAQRLAHQIHDQAFYVLLGLIALHVLAVLAYLLLRGQNLVLPMLHGRKPIGADEAAEGIAMARLLAALALTGVIMSGVIWGPGYL